MAGLLALAAAGTASVVGALALSLVAGAALVLLPPRKSVTYQPDPLS